MALLIDGGRIPPRWAEKKSLHPAGPNGRYDGEAECVKIAFINNMPDAALEDTEMQFMELLAVAAGDFPVRLKLYSLPKVPRGERGLQHLDRFYFDIDDLYNGEFDAVIMTGTEPRQPDLRQEPYWSALADVLDWAARNTVSTILSCLAAHAGVLHSDGILRQPLDDKQFGVFESSKVCDHELTRHTPSVLRFPHSRWNEVRENSLTACGYSILTKSALAGVDLFAMRKKKSLFVHFQGHPEYGTRTLLKEYRRDIKRFLRQERETYPTMPHGYFDASAAKLLTEFKQTAFTHPKEEQLAFFPEAIITEALENTWQSSAASIYTNWLQYVLSRKTESTQFVSMPVSYPEVRRKHSAVR
jgi:homoserine O-succinyltransferase/O-acetyltransferase